MKKKIHSVLVLSLLFIALGTASVKAQGGTYCNESLRFCMATSIYGDMQSSVYAFYASVSSGIMYNASFESYGAGHYGFIWIQYGGGTYTLESQNEGSKYQSGTLSTSGNQWIDIFAEASRGKSFVSVSW